LALKGQVINKIKLNDDDDQKVVTHCERDKRRAVINPLTGSKGRINRLVKRRVRDTPIGGHSCWIEIELAQVYLSKNERRMEHCPFVDKGSYYVSVN
jgi:hypothetical protein